MFCTAHVLGYNITAEEDALCERVQVRRALPALYFCNNFQAAWGAFAHGRQDGLWQQYNATDAVLHVWSTPNDTDTQHVQQDVCEGLWDTVPY